MLLAQTRYVFDRAVTNLWLLCCPSYSTSDSGFHFAAVQTNYQETYRSIRSRLPPPPRPKSHISRSAQNPRPLGCSNGERRRLLAPNLVPKFHCPLNRHLNLEPLARIISNGWFWFGFFFCYLLLNYSRACARAHGKAKTGKIPHSRHVKYSRSYMSR